MHLSTRRYGFGRTVICLMVVLRVASSQYESAGRALPPSASPPPTYEDQSAGVTDALYATQKPDTSSRTVSRADERTEAPSRPSSVSLEQVTTVAASSPTDEGNGRVEATGEEPKKEEEFRGGCVADTIFVIDSTSSVSKIFEKHIEYVKNVIELLDISPEANHVALIAYASHRKNRVRYSLSDAQSKEQAIAKLQALPFIGGITATGAALDVALKELDKTRSNVGANVVVVTDGFSYDHVEDQAIHLHALENVRTFAVSIGPYRREYELVILAGSEKNVFRGFDTFRELADRLQQCIAGQTPGVTGGGGGKSDTTEEDKSHGGENSVKEETTGVTATVATVTEAEERTDEHSITQEEDSKK